MKPNTISAEAGFDPRRGRWIPWVFVLAMGIVIAVNGVLIWQALTTFTGVTVGHAYDRGLAYNDVLAESARQEALGWQASLRVEGRVLHVAIDDREGRPVPGVLRGDLERPLEGGSVKLTLLAEAPGRYRAALDLPRAGQWEARLVLTGPGGREFDIRERIVVR
ncbi:FixH family protein [Pseudoroseomonas cervicalis]|uniref:FixH family protein n=1 Tax=Teichococcus cervicalis TaxID=204525 RepID=UPI0022F1BF17|nr:FixH family protein [Pseudoroseomonas cervicalis]WBV43847.1 FixH family protein [Pseudoroseomonas cervicalis]